MKRGFVENTMAAIKDRVIHMYHTEGAGGGHAPDLIKSASYMNVLPSSTNPTVAIYHQYGRRTSGYADGLPPFESIST